MPATSTGDDADADADGAAEQMDETAVKRLITNFEKRALKNTEMRIKFPDQPEKFMESEIELNVAIQEMHAIATAPHLYDLLTSTDTVKTLLQLLLHENTDVSCAVVDLLQVRLGVFSCAPYRPLPFSRS